MRQAKPWREMAFGAKVMTIVFYGIAFGIIAVAAGLLVKAAIWAWS